MGADSTTEPTNTDSNRALWNHSEFCRDVSDYGRLEELKFLVYGMNKRGSGFGEASRRHIKALSSLCQTQLNNNVKQLDSYNHIYIHSGFGALQEMQASGLQYVGKPIIGYAVWETSVLDKTRAKSLEGFDLILTASQFCKDAIQVYYKGEIKVLPHCVNQICYAPRRNDTFVFLCMFDYHSRFYRKNPEDVIRGFLAAFPDKTEKVKLVVKSSNSSLYYQKHLHNLAGGDNRIVFHNGYIEDLTKLMLSSDCLVSPHRGGGFELPLAEMMGYGKLVIGTRFGGNLEFMTDENSYLLDYELVEPLDEFFSEGELAQPNFDQLVVCMRKAVRDDLQRRRKAFNTILNGFTFDQLTKNTLAILKTL